MHRQFFICSSLAALAAPSAAFASKHDFAREIEALEKRNGGRLGVFAKDTASHKTVAYRANERFAMCSTFKLLVAGVVLAKVDAKQESLGRMISYGKSDLLDYAPITTANVEKGTMSVGDLCAAAVETSDNTAANLLLATVGGPAGVTRFLRQTGDSVTRLDRNEPSLNTAIEGDVRDTTTPAAMAATAQRLLLSSVLSASSRAQLEAWLDASTTGKERLRAGLPATWRVGDKTGTGENRAANDVAIARPPKGGAVLIASYYTGAPQATDRNAVHAEVARIVVRAFTST